MMSQHASPRTASRSACSHRIARPYRVSHTLAFFYVMFSVGGVMTSFCVVREGTREVSRPDCGPKGNRYVLKRKYNSRLLCYISLNKTGDMDAGTTCSLYTPAVAHSSAWRFRLAVSVPPESSTALTPLLLGAFGSRCDDPPTDLRLTYVKSEPPRKYTVCLVRKGTYDVYRPDYGPNRKQSGPKRKCNSTLC